MSDFTVLIAGTGLGGLTLAQSLRAAGIRVRMFERDSSPWERPQGYRLHLEADALDALREVLPPRLHRLFEATAMRTQPFTTILSTDLSVIRRLPTADNQDDRQWPEFAHADPIHANVDRATLREILLAGLDDAIEYNKRLLSYEADGSGVTAAFADGSTARGDVLVGADGIRSAVRALRAPQLTTMDAGVQAIYGRIPWSAAATLVPTEVLTDIFAIAFDERKVFLGLGAVEFPTAPEHAADDAGMPGALARRDDYVVCIVGGRHEHWDAAHRELRDRPAADIQAAALSMLGDWPDAAAALVAAGEPESFFSVDMYSSVPAELGRPTNVTILGDAAHAMTPTLGRGANLAMRDGALLGRHLQAVARGEIALPDALAEYESGLTGYGFDVVREAVALGEQRMGQNPLPA